MPAKRKEDKVADADTITINRAEYQQSRDGFLSVMQVVQEAMRDMTSNYIVHTQRVLGESGSIESVLANLREAAGNAAAAVAAQRSLSPAKADEKPDRKKRIHDPNAPKRPLTPFFLYMQTARPIITADLGPEAQKGSVSEEGTRRWKVMGLVDRASWTRAYRDNLKLYNARVHAYKAGNVAAKLMTDDEARLYHDTYLAGAGDQEADAQLVNEALAVSPDAEVEVEADADAEADSDSEDEEEEAAPVVVRTPTPPPPPPPKTPKVKTSRKKAAAKTETPVLPPAPMQTPAPIQPPATIAPPSSEPDKKRKRKSKAETDKEKKALVADAPVNSIESEELLVQTPAAPKSVKPKKKKSKTEA